MAADTASTMTEISILLAQQPELTQKADIAKSVREQRMTKLHEAVQDMAEKSAHILANEDEANGADASSKTQVSPLTMEDDEAIARVITNGQQKKNP